MMKIQLVLITISILSCFNQLKSQVPFWPIEARECIEQGCPDFSTILYFGTFSGLNTDTIIQGKYCTLVSGGVPYSGPLGGFPHFIYQDSSRIYFYNPEDESFQLLYDFELGEGDSYWIKVDEAFYNTDSIKVTINMKYEEMVNGFKFRTQFVTIEPQNDPGLWWIGSTIIKEGIGGIYGNLLLLTDPHTLTHCYTKTLWYETPETGIIPIQPPSDLSSGCPITSVNTENQNEWLLETYPNPSNGSTTIRYDLPPGFPAAEIRHFDSTGRLCAIYPIKNQKGEISMENLAAGLHFITLFVDGQVRKSGKMLVLK